MNIFVCCLFIAHLLFYNITKLIPVVKKKLYLRLGGIIGYLCAMCTGNHNGVLALLAWKYFLYRHQEKMRVKGRILMHTLRKDQSRVRYLAKIIMSTKTCFFLNGDSCRNKHVQRLPFCTHHFL